jgi:acetyltransferase-like isoleucine patch superfamily enzyme
MLERLRSLQKALQRKKRECFKRRVSLGDLVTDRWDNAREYGFGEGSSCYDNVLITGDVKVGRNTWIGPNVVLDGFGGLEIGDNCTISAGAQVYSHSTVAREMSGGTAAMETKRTVIGSNVYIAPNCVVAMGVTIGDRVVIGALSFVNSDIPGGSKAWGTPARVIGDVDSLING